MASKTTPWARADQAFKEFIAELSLDPLRVRRATSEPHRPLPYDEARQRAFEAETTRYLGYLRRTRRRTDQLRRIHATQDHA